MYQHQIYVGKCSMDVLFSNVLSKNNYAYMHLGKRCVAFGEVQTSDEP